MAENGIGVSVLRKEDNRFLIGKGTYTDDINVVGQTHAVFVRSPHAHATINAIDTSAAAEIEGVVAIFTGDDLAADGIGPLICGVTVTSDDGEPHRAPAHPALGPERDQPHDSARVCDRCVVDPVFDHETHA